MTTITNGRGLVATVDGADCLIGSRCTECDTHTFPVQLACPRCGAATSEVALPTEGTLWSWTVQRLQPKPPYRGPDEFEPFAVGYVDLGPLRVETRLVGKPIDSWQIGEPVQLSVGEPDTEGNIWTYRFQGASE